MLKTGLIIGILLTTSSALGQRTLEKVMDRLSGDEVPLVSVTEVRVNPSYIRLDAREKEEFDVSHLPHASHIGYDNFDPKEFTSSFPDKEATYVVYCSVGIRSGKIGEKLQQMGYSHVRNLSGGIFKWVEEGNIILDSNEKPTHKVHAYNRFWGMLLKKGEKVYGPEDEEKDEG
ncbi:rhodanese-like domain-containing protein [Muriicola marianensis]|nr:rhodanese-like domain-containing protein [Muriicola marianensis]